MCKSEIRGNIGTISHIVIIKETFKILTSNVSIWFPYYPMDIACFCFSTLLEGLRSESLESKRTSIARESLLLVSPRIPLGLAGTVSAKDKNLSFSVPFMLCDHPRMIADMYFSSFFFCLQDG